MAVYGKGGKEIREAFRRRKLRVAVYGLGKMGLPLAAVFSDKGAIVTGVDTDPAVVSGISAGKCHVRGEPGLPEMVRDNWKAKRISATADPVKASQENDVKIILIPTLLDEKSMPDLSGVLTLCEKIGKGLKKKDMVIIETTMPIGATAKRIRPALQQASGLAAGKDFGLAYCPERTYSGRAIQDITLSYPKVTGGYDEKSTRTASAIYRVIDAKGTIETDCTTAEAVKVYEGIYRDVNIALANELAVASTELSVNAVDVYRIANTQPYCHLHSPGAGVGGHCIPVYPYFVINSGIKADTSLLKLSRKVNDRMADHIVGLTRDALKENGRTLRGSRVLVLGLTFRGGVKELRHSRSIAIAEKFRDLGAETYAFDPLLSREETEKLGFRYGGNERGHINGGFSGMDAAVTSNDHAEFRKIKWGNAIKEMRTKILIDARQTIRPERARALGFTYRGIGFA